jgi:hypothetical protein
MIIALLLLSVLAPACTHCNDLSRPVLPDGRARLHNHQRRHKLHLLNNDLFLDRACRDECARYLPCAVYDSTDIAQLHQCTVDL